MVTTNKPLYVMGLAGGDGASSFSSRMRRKNDGAGFADLMEGSSGGRADNVAPSDRGEARHASRPGTDARLLQARALNTLGQMIEEGDDAGGLYKRKGLEAMRTALAASASRAGAERSNARATPSEQAGTVETDVPAVRADARRANLERDKKGIALPDRRRGIPLRVPQGAGRALVQNVALNRNRTPLETGSIHDVRETSRSRRAGRAVAASREATPGKLAARFESGSEGIAAIGYDRNGGTSYGKYQIASRPGTMTAFLAFLDKEAPDLGQRLRSAGPANTGSRQGRMPQEWKAIAAAEPERFEQLQERFIRQSHYEPALAAVRRMGYNTRDFSPAMQEVLWSTAVQHGPAGAARIFRQASANLGQNSAHEQHLIREVYDLRAQRFGSSSAQIQAAARKRMESEKLLALAMTERSGRTTA